MITGAHMKLTELSALIANIPEISIDLTVKLKDSLIINYQSSVKNKLKEILDSKDRDEQKYSALEDFLKNNWELTKGSLFSYTSMHDAEITKVLCKVAELICDFNNSNKLETGLLPFVPLQFLMPGVELETLIPYYNSLNSVELLKLDSKDKQEFLQLETKYANTQMPEFSEEENEIVYSWNQFKFMSEVTGIVDESKRPQIRKKLFDKIEVKEKIEKYNSLKEKLEIKQSLIDAQQDHIEKNKFIVEKDFCIPNIPLEVILKTFVLNEDSSSLIPVSVILENLNLRPYDFLCVVFDKEIRNSTNQRIISHSGETLAIYSIMNRLSIVESDKNHFLGNLMELCRQLKFNDSHSGIGKEDNAGKGAYPAIIAFKEYYDTLGYQLREWKEGHALQEGFIYIKFYDNPTEGLIYAIKSKDAVIKKGFINQENIDGLFYKDSNYKNTDKNNSKFYFEKSKNYKEEILKVIIDQGNASLEDEERNKVPIELKHEIEKLLILSSDSSKNHNAIVNIDTCIASRRAVLENLISSEEQKQLLAKIALFDVSRANFKAELCTNLKRAKDALKNALNKPESYQGKDSLDISIKLLIHFEVDLTIQDTHMLFEIIKHSTNDDISYLCEQDKYLKQFIGLVIYNLENLTSFVLECSEDNLQILLKEFSNKGHITKIFDSAKTLSKVIDSVSNNKKINIILEELKGSFKYMITSCYDFECIVKHLNDAQTRELCTALKDNFKNIIVSGWQFNYVVRYLGEEQVTEILYNDLKDNLQNIIKSGYGFSCVLEHLNDFQRAHVYATLKDNLQNIIKSIWDCYFIFKYLNKSQIAEICVVLKDNLKSVITSKYDFDRIVEHLNESQKIVLCNALKEMLRKYINDSNDYDIFSEPQLKPKRP